MSQWIFRKSELRVGKKKTTTQQVHKGQEFFVFLLGFILPRIPPTCCNLVAPFGREGHTVILAVVLIFLQTS